MNIYAEPAADRPPLRIGLMLDSPRVYAWVSKIVQDIVSSAHVDLSFVVLNDVPPAAPQRPWQRLKAAWPNILYSLYFKLDRYFYACQPDAFAPCDLSGLIARTPSITVRPIQTKHTDRLQPGDIARIREANLDVLLRFGFRILKGDILQCARYGIWSYHHDDNREYRGAPPLFWEIYERNPISGSILQILSEQLDAGRVIYRGWSATRFASWNLNRNANYWKTAEFVGRRLRELYAFGWDDLQSLPTVSERLTYNKPIYRLPSNSVMVRFLSRLVGFRAGTALRKLRREKHYLACQKLGENSGANSPAPVLLSAAPRHQYRDPCLFANDGQSYLFFTDENGEANNTSISALALDGHGKGSPAWTLQGTGGASAPLVFRWADRVFMLAEARQRCRLELYAARQFPRDWELCSVLVEGREAVGPALLQHNGKLWLFANIAMPGSWVEDELYVFHADSPLGPWQPHPRNPVVSDVRRARSAGGIFEHSGELIRPSLDSSLAQGFKVRWNRIDLLSPTEYRETTVDPLVPDWIPADATIHAVSACEGYRAFAYSVRRRLGAGPFATAPRLETKEGVPGELTGGSSRPVRSPQSL